MKHHIKIGKLGEEIATMFLMKHGVKILDRNYYTKIGELDIVGKKARTVIFYEVKTVSRENLPSNYGERHDPEENMHPGKIENVVKTAQIYLKEHFSHETPKFKIDGITVELDMENKRAKVKIIENINIP